LVAAAGKLRISAEVTVRDYEGKESPIVIKPQLPQVKR
jgi:hypothetical protein